MYRDLFWIVVLAAIMAPIVFVLALPLLPSTSKIGRPGRSSGSPLACADG
jgi:hypothetical protein